MKCSKKTNKSFNQTILADTWLQKRKNVSTKSTPTKTPSKISKQQKASASNSNVINKENLSDDSEIIESSQDISQSKLRRKVNKSLSRKSESPKSSPEKRNILSLDSIQIKEEIDEIFNDIVDFEGVEMTHDLDDLLINGKLSNSLEYSQTTFCHSVNMDSVKEEEDEQQLDEQTEDPLYINENVKDKNDGTVKSDKEKETPKSRLKLKRKNTSIDQKSKFNNNCSSDNSSDKTNPKIIKQWVEKLSSLKIQLQHEVPPQHKIEPTAGCCALTEEQLLKFESYGPIKKGTYTEQEDKIIKNNWEDFCTIHKWNKNHVTPFIHIKHNGKYYIRSFEERQNFIRFMANGLPWRSLFSVYCRFRNLYNTNVNNGKYTEKEDEIIIAHMRNSSTSEHIYKNAELAKILNRKRASIWYRYQLLKKKYNLTNSNNSSNKNKTKKNNVKKKNRKLALHQEKASISFIENQVYTNVTWTAPLVKRYIDLLMEVTRCKEFNELKQHKIEGKTWNTMQKKMSIDHVLLKNFWYYQLYMQMFSSSPIYLDNLKIKLIEHIYQEEVQTLEDIKWDDVSLHFDGITDLFLLKVFTHLIKHAETKIASSQFKKIMEYLYNVHIAELEEKPTDVILPKLCYKSGKIICSDKGKEKKISNRSTADPFSEENE